ncbi:Hypothetical_protein [Hexamita inflata]|uniref:Hypothetical_protein n=1 Tax=Hexamita inflata TaxID=28002 RepID=A0AA86P9P7_9EUKA|nr:Hypothetical protein HINF_LOCUS21218 [Hexamita inflata]
MSLIFQTTFQNVYYLIIYIQIITKSARLIFCYNVLDRKPSARPSAQHSFLQLHSRMYIIEHATFPTNRAAEKVAWAIITQSLKATRAVQTLVWQNGHFFGLVQFLAATFVMQHR